MKQNLAELAAIFAVSSAKFKQKIRYKSEFNLKIVVIPCKFISRLSSVRSIVFTNSSHSYYSKNNSWCHFTDESLPHREFQHYIYRTKDLFIVKKLARDPTLLTYFNHCKSSAWIKFHGNISSILLQKPGKPI